MARKKKSKQEKGSSLGKAIRQCVDSGKVEFGANRGVKNVLSGHAKLIIFSSNCPEELLQDAMHFCRLSGIPTIIYGGTSFELGTIAGRPHPVSMLTVYEAGNSGILQMAK